MISRITDWALEVLGGLWSISRNTSELVQMVKHLVTVAKEKPGGALLAPPEVTPTLYLLPSGCQVGSQLCVFDVDYDLAANQAVFAASDGWYIKAVTVGNDILDDSLGWRRRADKGVLVTREVKAGMRIIVCVERGKLS